MTFRKGEMVPEFEDVAYTMEVGDFELVESDYGYHIINKLAHIMPEDAEVQMVEQYTETMVEQYTVLQKQEAYNDIYSQWILDYEVVVNDKVWGEVMTSYQMADDGVETEAE